MRRLLVVAALSLAVAAGPASAAVAASPALRLTIRHVLSGCHTWVQGKHTLGPEAKITVKRGTRVAIRPDCPMDFDLTQLAGPRLRLGGPRLYGGQTRVLTFTKPGTYRLRVLNVQTSVEKGFETLGPDSELTLTVVAR